MEWQNSIQRSFHEGRLGNARGSVVILTLWAVVFLALLANAIAANVAAHLRVASDLKWGARTRGIGMRAVATSAAVLENDTTSYDALHETWATDNTVFKDVPYGSDGHYSVVRGEAIVGAGESRQYGLADEGGKVNLNRAPVSVLSLLMQAGNMTSARADDLAHFIVDWRDANTTAEGKAGPEPCAGMALPYACKNADFEALEELWWMPGMSPAVYEAIRGTVTVYGTGVVNANTASSLALRSVGLTSDGAEKVVQWRSSPGHFFDNNSAIIAHAPEMGMSKKDQEALATAAGSGLLGIRSELFRGDVQATFGGRIRRVASFIVDRKGKLKWWRE